MTIFASGPEDFLMRVVFFVTLDTWRGNPLVTLTHVAFLADDLLMFAKKGVLGFGVIKTHLFPLGRCVALVAGRSQVSFVRVIFFVTLKTVGWGFFEKRVLMTFQTGDVLVFSDERITGFAVIKGALFPVLS